MCLCIKEWANEYVEFRLRRSPEQYITAWKMYEFSRDSKSHRKVLRSAHVSRKVIRDKQGYVVSNRAEARLPICGIDEVEEKPHKRVTRGIHVFLHREDAEKMRREEGQLHRVVEVRCYKKDLIAAGTNNGDTPGAVFNRIYITDKEWKKHAG